MGLGARPFLRDEGQGRGVGVHGFHDIQGEWCYVSRFGGPVFVMGRWVWASGGDTSVDDDDEHHRYYE